jgi:hypothetical protein
MTLIPRDLAKDRALPFFEQQLRLSGFTLSQVALDRLERGHFSVLAPAETTHDALYDLASGGVIAAAETKIVNGLVLQRLRSTAADLAAVVAADAKVAGNLFTALLHEPYLRKGNDSELLRGVIDIEGALFKPFSLALFSSEMLAAEIDRYTVSWSFLLLLTTLPPQSATLSKLLDAARLISVGAYDGESYAIWRPGTENSASSFL